MSQGRSVLLLSCSNRKASGGTSAWQGDRFFPGKLASNRCKRLLERRNDIRQMLLPDGPARLYDRDRNGGYRDESPPNFPLANGPDFGGSEPALYRPAHERYTGRFFGRLTRLAPNFWREPPVEILFVSGLYGLVFWDEWIQDYDCHFADYSDPDNIPHSKVSAHWGDELSEALIEFLQRQPSSVPITTVYDLLSEELYQSLFNWRKSGAPPSCITGFSKSVRGLTFCRLSRAFSRPMSPPLATDHTSRDGTRFPTAKSPWKSASNARCAAIRTQCAKVMSPNPGTGRSGSGCCRGPSSAGRSRSRSVLQKNGAWPSNLLTQ